MLITVWLDCIENGLTREIKSISTIEDIIMDFGIDRIVKITITDISPHYAETKNTMELPILKTPS